MALINSKYVADILEPEQKYRTLVDLYEEEIETNKLTNLLYAFIILAIVYPFLFFY